MVSQSPTCCPQDSLLPPQHNSQGLHSSALASPSKVSSPNCPLPPKGEKGPSSRSHQSLFPQPRLLQVPVVESPSCISPCLNPTFLKAQLKRPLLFSPSTIPQWPQGLSQVLAQIRRTPPFLWCTCSVCASFTNSDTTTWKTEPDPQLKCKNTRDRRPEFPRSPRSNKGTRNTE